VLYNPVLYACWWSTRPNHVAYSDKGNNIFCGCWQYICRFWYVTPQRDEFHKKIKE
jgi:hypothetical protein